MSRALIALAPDAESVGDSVAGFDAGNLLVAGIVFAAGLVAALVAKSAVHRVAARHNEIIARLLARTAAAIVVVVGLVYALSELGIRVGLLLGALGVGGFALAFALQDTLSNLIAGIILQVRQPFTYSDLVSINGYEGTVTDIDLRAVEMKVFSGETVLIPSAEVLQNPIENWTRRPTRRVAIGVGVEYDADIDHASDVIVRALQHCDAVLDDPAPSVGFDGFGASSIDLVAYAWFRSADNAILVRRQAATAVKRALDDAGVDIPFPIRTLQNPDGSAVAGDRPFSESSAR